MYINSCIPWMKDQTELQKVVNLSFRLGYQAVIIDLRSEKEYNEYKKSSFYHSENFKLDFPITVSKIPQIKPLNQPIALIPRITLTIKNPNDLKQKLSFWVSKRILIAVESIHKETLEVAARDGRVDIISIPNMRFQQALTKGIISLARQNQIMFDLSITPLLEVEHFKRTQILRVLYRLFKSAKPISNIYILGSHENIKNNSMLIRGPRETVAILTSILHIPEYFAKEMVSKNLEKLFLRYIKRYLSLFIEPGVEIVDIIKEGEKN
ncbi:RNase P subunit p30 family protein [Candidatus Lokiarchaeum ossiferum]|uniref:RNase P subunit p30 family protein n=1 Tax=Candidatus Lokiarchaeum ossiferum TaxID=2951803 RepID=UPI00352CCCCD